MYFFRLKIQHFYYLLLEFEVVIKIYFHDPVVYKPVTFYHILKLFQPPSSGSNSTEETPTPPPVIDTKKKLVSEFYDEIVFYEPSQLMQQMLNTINPASTGSWSHDTDCKFINYFFEFLITF